MTSAANLGESLACGLSGSDTAWLNGVGPGDTGRTGTFKGPAPGVGMGTGGLSSLEGKAVRM